MANDSMRSESSLATVLYALGIDAKDALVAELQSQGCLKHTRLACHGLRDAVDGNLQSVRVNVSAEDQARLHNGQPCLPLHRWPRCSDVTIAVVERPEDEESCPVGDLLALPFSGLPAGALQGVLKLTIGLDFDDWAEVAIPSLQLVALLNRLPNLRRLTLSCPLNHDDPVEVQHLYDALSSLPHLEDLRLLCGRYLDQVGLLADKLKHLTVLGELPDAAAFDADMITGISKLDRLRTLCVLLAGNKEMPQDALDSHADILRLLLDHVPHSVELLELPSLSIFDPHGGDEFSIELQLHHGRLTSFTTDQHDTVLGDLACLAHKVLLPSRALAVSAGPGGQQGRRGLEKLVLPRLSVLQRFDVRDPVLVDLVELLKGCGTVDIATMHIDAGLAGYEHLEQVVDWFRKPRELRLRIPEFPCPLHVRLRPAGQPPAGLDAGVQWPSSTTSVPPPPPPPTPLPDYEEFTRLVMQRLLPDSAEQVAPGAPREPIGASGQQVLVLRGPLIATLCSAPDALGNWVERLLRSAQATAASLAGDTPAGDDDARTEAAAVRHVPAYWCQSVLNSPRAVVLVECGTEYGAEAVQALVREQMARAAGGAGVGADAAGSSALQVARVPAEVARGARASAQQRLRSEPRLLDAVITHAVDQVLQAAWDGADGAAATGVSERQRLKRMLELWLHAQEVLPVVRF